MRLVV